MDLRSVFSKNWDKSHLRKIGKIENGVCHLRPWQEEGKKHFFDNFGTDGKCGYVLNAPTGSGKSKLVSTIILELLKKNKKTIHIITVPQNNICR